MKLLPNAALAALVAGTLGVSACSEEPRPNEDGSEETTGGVAGDGSGASGGTGAASGTSGTAGIAGASGSSGNGGSAGAGPAAGGVGGVAGATSGVAGAATGGTGGTTTNAGAAGVSAGGNAGGGLGGSAPVAGSGAGGAGTSGIGGAGGRSGSGGKASGGMSGSSGASGGAGSGGKGGSAGNGGDRCDVGVYDAGTPPVSRAITNGENVHDPTMIMSGSTYYVFNTGLWTRTSTNMTSYTSIARVLSPNPGWIGSNVTGVTDLWAPDASYFDGRYHLYYAASTFNSNRSCIGHATRTALTSGAWTDDGGPVFCSNVSSSVNWNAIDPNVILDETGGPWLVFGSGWDGIHVVRLTSTGALDSASAFTRIATRTAGVIEGPAMIRRCGYYYLFTSWDACCQGASSTYNIRVGRSTSMTGGFVDKNGTALTQGGGTLLVGAGNGWVGPGGQSVLFVGNRAYLVYHAYASSDGHFQLHLSDLYFDASGWPVTTASP